MAPRHGGPRMTKEDFKARKGTLARLLKYIFKKYGAALVVVAMLIVVSAVCTARGTMFMQSLIDDFIKPMLAEGSRDFSGLAKAIVSVAGFYVAGIIANFTYSLIMIFVAQGTLKSLRLEMFNKMESLPISYFDSHSHGDIMSMYTNDIDTLRQMIGQSIPQMLNSAITIVTVLVCMIRLSGTLTIVTLLMVFVMLFVSGNIAKKSGGFFVKQQAALGAVNGNIEEIITGQKVVKVFCHEKVALEEFDKLNNELFNNAYSANKFANIMAPVNAQLGNLSYVVIAVVGGLLAISGFGGLTLGKLASFLTFNKSFNMPINQVTMQMNAIIMAMAGAERVFKLIDEEPEVDDGYVTLVRAREENGQIVECEERTGTWAWKHFHKADGTTTYTKLAGDIVFDGVDFGYNQDKQILFDIKMFAQPGQKLAFVGATGAGKTTIINLINRFYDVSDGKIRYDGINVNKIKKADLRRSLGIVLQDTHLFTGTVAENIRYGKLDATDEEVKAAARLANAESFIKRLPDGYDTMLTGDGGNLSQGQRQLLAIARAAIENAPVMILDEATSSIDTRTEKIVQSGMDKLMAGRTSFVIAHRLSTIKNSDCIMVMDKGRIIERGNHDELIEEKGKYYQLYTGKIINA